MTDLPTLDDEIGRIARESFGLASLRPGLEDAIAALLAGRDVLAIMPTGYGKSSIYEVAGTMFGGVTVVVSPLIALQEDQVRSLAQAPDAPAAVSLNSTHGAAETRDAWQQLEDGDARFVLLAPEQLANEEVRARLKALPIELFVVDEAHCVSSWGHDFRPDYLILGEAVEALGHPPVLAMTATGAGPVRDEIAVRLGLREHLLVARGFDRPNLQYAVARYESDAEKRRGVIEHVASLDRPGLVYVSTRRDTESYAAELAGEGVRVAGYHGGMRAAERESVYDAFMAGEVDIVVATSAFGMGIDKPDVRFVVHAAVTDSMDSYYQEVGRAGRDGGPAHATLHYRPEDFALTNFFEGGSPARAELSRVFSAIAQTPGMSRSDLAQALEVSPRSLTRVVGLLDDAGAIMADDGLHAIDISPRTAASRAVEHAETRQRIEHSRVQMMQQFAETASCRRQFLLGYFGEQLPEPCGHCDTCESGSAYTWAEEHQREQVSGDAGRDNRASGFGLDTHVEHKKWGRGVVMRAQNDRITVFFDAEGYKVLSLDAVERGNLLSVVEAPVATG